MAPLVGALRRISVASDPRSDVSDAAHRLAGAVNATAGDPATTARAAAFWLGIAFPLVHVPLLFARGLTDATTAPLVALWTLHALALAVGAGHDPRVGDAG
jgi:cytochrome c oxidase assembly factor CtaG